MRGAVGSSAKCSARIAMRAICCGLSDRWCISHVDRPVVLIIAPLGTRYAIVRYCLSCTASARDRAVAQIREGARASWAPLAPCVACRHCRVFVSRACRGWNFALWSTACGATLWPAGSFAHAYDANRKTASSRRTQWQFASEDFRMRH